MIVLDGRSRHGPEIRHSYHRNDVRECRSCGALDAGSRRGVSVLRLGDVVVDVADLLDERGAAGVALGMATQRLARFTCVWEFHVAPSAVAQFEFEYGPRGAWVTLFRKAPGYIETLLLRDHRDPLRYVTVDRWESEEAHDVFRAANLTDYEEIDRRCQGYTTHERSFGEFAEFVLGIPREA